MYGCWAPFCFAVFLGLRPLIPTKRIAGMVWAVSRRYQLGGGIDNGDMHQKGQPSGAPLTDMQPRHHLPLVGFQSEFGRGIFSSAYQARRWPFRKIDGPWKKPHLTPVEPIYLAGAHKPVPNWNPGKWKHGPPPVPPFSV